MIVRQRETQEQEEKANDVFAQQESAGQRQGMKKLFLLFCVV